MYPVFQLILSLSIQRDLVFKDSIFFNEIRITWIHRFMTYEHAYFRLRDHSDLLIL